MAQFYVFWCFWIAFFSNLLHFRSLQRFAAFDTKWRNMTSLKHHFLKNFSMDFSEILEVDIRLMLDKVLKVLPRYRLSLLSYRGNREGANIHSPPSALRGVRYVFGLYLLLRVHNWQIFDRNQHFLKNEA